MKQNLKVVSLLRSHHINKPLEGPILVPFDGRTDILGEIQGSAVAPEQDLTVKIYLRKVYPHGTVGFFIKSSPLQPLQDLFPTALKGLTLIIYLVKGDSGFGIGSFYSLDCPAVHSTPEFSYLRVIRLPSFQHFPGLGLRLGVLLGPLIVFNIIFAYKVIAF